MPEVGADAAVEFSDWIYEAEQVIGSLSDKAALWFSACLEVARNTYDQYVVSSPLQRLSLTPSIPDELRDPRWSRLEKKVTMMLLAAMCKPAKDEVITHRISTAPSLLYRLFVLYQPGGSAERGTILRHLEGHSAGNDVYQCITALRKWRRYLQRAEDIGISVPDGSVLLKGVEAITAQALEALPDVKFRVALAKNDLQLHSRPEADSVIRYSNAIMAELQTAAPVRRTGSTSEPARLKNINAAEAPGTSSPSAKAKAKASIPCKFFLTETGCSRGASCGYSHQFTKKEKAGRCWTCGSTQHLSSTCTAKKGGNSPSRDPKTGPKGQPTKGPAVSQLAAATASMSSAPSTLDNSSMVSSSLPSTSSSSAPGPSISEVVAATTGDTEAQMKQLLEEANAMMKEMRKLKMLALSSTEVENNAVARRCGPMSGRTGLLDSGASHPFRSASTDELQEATRVKVQLANGSEEEEILVEQYSRVESESRGHLEDTRSQISEFLDYIHEELIGLEKVRTAACLNTVTKCSSSRTSESGSEDVDYEKLLDELEDDLRVVHTVPVAQVKRVLERWVESIKKEVENLFASKTLRRVTAEEARRLEKSGQVVFAPAKCVFTLKPPQEAGRRAKRKCRLVICGNHVERGQEGQEDLYAAGTSSDSLRMSLVIAATRGWLGAISDVTGAFLLATWPEGKTRYGFFPPKVVRDSGFGEGEAWIIERPIYGLRESPKIWSDFRNKRLRSARVKYGDIILVLRPTIVEPELWMILCEVTGVLYGLMVLYVDDILYLSNREVITAIHEFVTSEWPTSPLEWLEEHKAVRYLGVEILREPRIDSHGNQYHVYTIGQSAYVQDLLRSHDMQEVHPTQLPVPREWVEEAEASEEVEEGFTEETLRRAQRVVGEGLWLSTRTRPDILYVINHLASLVAKRPDYVLRVGKRLLAYLAGTKDLRLQLGAPHDDDHAVTCYTDASYAPFGKRSFGAAVICLHGSPISWKAGRQSFVTLSVMEAELYAATQGCLLLEGVYALANEVLPGRYCRVLAVDNTSAVAMLTGGHGSQRTRHLKIRANYVREAVEQGWLVVRHVEGDQQLADLATKLQPRLRLQQLLRLWNFTGSCISSALMTMQAKVLMILATLASLVCPTRAEDTSRTKDPVPVASWDELLIFVMMIALIAVGVWELIKYVSKMIWKKIKMAKKAKKIQRFGDFATEVARQEIRSQEAVRSRLDYGVRVVRFRATRLILRGG
ncbi:RE1 [Symbiodinium microadriaticum]|nr:RE1 [Symbiodinium microadriaticum]